MRRKSAKLYAIVLAAAVMSSACIPTAQLMAKKELNEGLSEDETEEEEAVEEDVHEEPVQEEWAAAEEPFSLPLDGSVEEEAQAGTGESEEAQAEPDVNQEEYGTEETNENGPDSDDTQDGEEPQDSADEEDAASDDGDDVTEEFEEEKDTEAVTESESAPEEANVSESDQSYDDAGAIGDEITDDSSASSKKKSKKKKKSSKEKASEPSQETDSNEGTVDIIGKETEAEDEAEESEGEPVWDYSSTVSDGTYWDSSWYVQEDFRFSQVDKVPVISEGDIEGVSVYSATDNSQKVVGILPYFSIAYVLEDDVDGGDWLYIESGNVRGFIKADEVAADDYALDLIDEIGEDNFTSGYMTCEKADNDAFTYTKTTVYDVLADKVYAVSLVKGDIYEYPSTDSRAVGESGSGTLAYVLEETDDGWMFVESGDVRGFIQSSSILSGDLAEDIVNDIGEDEIVKATQLIEPEENRSLYYTLKSVFTTADSLGEKIAEYALSLVGQTKYVWGGTSLIFGADCSGFTQSVFASFGINIPRLAEDQGASGEVVASLADAKPGDIIYYSSGPHVGIYIGNGQVVQCSGGSANTASNPGRGATVSAADYMHITSIRRYIIPTSERKVSGSANADPTNYTQDQLELIWAIVAQEDNGSYEGALAVISSAMNRVDSPQWASCGSNALEQLTAPGQYCYSIDLNWMPRLGGNVPDYVKQAVSDCLDKGIRNHSYTSFRSYYTAGSVQIAGGNYYFA